MPSSQDIWQQQTTKGALKHTNPMADGMPQHLVHKVIALVLLAQSNLNVRSVKWSSKQRFLSNKKGKAGLTQDEMA